MADKNYYIILPNGKSKMYSEKDFNTPNVQNFINDKNNGASVLEQVPYDANDKNTRDTDVYTLTLANGKSKDYSSADFNSPNVQKWLSNNPKVAVSRFRQYNPYLDEAEQVGSDTDNAQYVVTPTDPNSNEPQITISADEYKANPDKYAPTSGRSVVRVSPDGNASSPDFMEQVDYDRKVKQLDDFLAANKELLDKYDTAMAGAVGDTSPAADMTAYIRKNPDSDIARAVAERERLLTERNANPYYQKLRKDSIEEAKGIIDTINGGDDKSRADKAARKYAKDAEKILEAPEEGDGSGFKDFIKGHKDTFNDADFWTMGISAIVANSRSKKEIDEIREKLQGKPINIADISPDNVTELQKYLDDDEIRLLQSLSLYAKAQADRALDTSNMYQAGMTAAQSLEFMVEFMATSGISSAIRKGVGSVAGKVIESASRNIANEAARKIAVGATMAAEAVAAPALQAAATTYLHPSSWRNVSDEASYQFDQETGELAKKDFWTAFKDTTADNFIETWSEMALDPIYGVIGEGLGKVGKTGLAKAIKSTPLGQFAALIDNNVVARTLRKAGFHGYVGEMLEEVLGAGTRQLFGVDDQAWEQFWDKDNLGQMAVAFLPMSLVGSVGGSVAHKIKSRKAYNEEEPFIREMMRTRGYSDTEIDEKLSRKVNTMDDIADNINDIVSSLNDIQSLSEDEKQHLINFADGFSSTKLYDAIQEQQRTDAKNEINDELEQKIGPYWLEAPVSDDGEVHKEVREIKYADGRRAFVTSPEASNGQLAAIDEDGKHIFIDEAEIASGVDDGSILSDTRTSLNDFLNKEREGRRKGAESARMDTEYRDRLEQVRNQAVPGAAVNLGTVEAPVTGTIIGWNGEKFVVESAERGAEEYDVNQMANILGVNLNVKSDADIEAQQETDAQSMLDLSDQINSQAAGMVFTDENGLKHKLDVVFDTWMEPDGTWMGAVMSGEEEYDIPMADLAQQFSSYLAEKNGATEDTPAQSEPAKSEEAIEEPEEDNTPRDFRGNPLPLKDDGSVNQTALWNSDPEAWARWNDANPNKRVDTKAYVQGRIDSLTGDIKKLQKAIDKETKTTGDFDAIDRYASQIDDKLARQGELQQILDKYAAEEKAAAEKEKARQLELNEPQNITQLAVRMLQEVKAHSLNRDSFKKELGWGNSELAQFFPWWAKKGSGMSLDALAEKMVERDGEYGFVPMVGDAEQKDTQVAKDALIAVMQSISRPGEVRDRVMNENKAFEDAQKDAEVAAIEADVMARYGMTMDEYNALSDEEKAQLDAEPELAAQEQSVENGPFGPIFRQFVGKAKEAIEYLRTVKTGEAVGALTHKDIGQVNLVYGNEKAGLAKIESKHPEVLDKLQEILDGMKIISESPNRIKLESDKYYAVISRDYLGNPHDPWLLTAFEKKNSVPDNTMNTGETLSSEQNDTATLQNTVSDIKGTEISENTNIPEENSAEDLELNGELYNISDLESQFKSDVEMLLEDNGVDVEVVGVKLIGSRIAGSPRVDSDLDLLVEYKGDYSEDTLFNLLNSEDWEFNGVKLDINPITEGKSGTIEQFLTRNADYAKNENESVSEEETETDEEVEEEGPVPPVHVTGAEYEISPNAASEEEIDATPVSDDEVDAIRFGGWDVLRSERTGEEIKTYGGTTLFSPGHESGVHVTMMSANGGRRNGDSTAEYLAKYLKANGFVSIEKVPSATKNKYGYWINKFGVITGADVIILESSKKGWANSSAVSIARLDNGKWVAEAGKSANVHSEQFDSKVDALNNVLGKLKKHYEEHKDEKGDEMFGAREKKDEQNLIKHLETKVIPAAMQEEGQFGGGTSASDISADEYGEQLDLFGAAEESNDASQEEKGSKPKKTRAAKKAKKARPDGALFDTDENFDEDVVNTTDVPVEVIVYPGNEDNPQACRIHLFEKDGKWNSIPEVWADNGSMSKAGTNSGSYPYNSREEAIEKAVSYFKWYRDNKAGDWGTDGINEFLDYVTFIPKAVERAKETAPKEAVTAENKAVEASPVEEPKGQYGANNKLVTTERYEELKKRMIAKMNQLNLGFDPETLAIGCEMAAYHIEAGARLFVDYAQRMIADLGDAIKPYLKSLYNGARDLPGMEDYAAEMDSYDEVSATDVKNIGLENTNEYNEGDLVIYKGKSMKIVGVHPKTLDLEYNPTGFLPVTSMGVPVTDVTKFISFHTEDISELVEAARQEVNTEPTESQKEAGNYKMGHVKIEGYDFTMENPKGSVRKGVDRDGNAWEITMNNDYGYIRGTKSVDGDHIDMFLSDNPEHGDVYVVDQVNPDGSFDEHKVMYGFNSAEEASAAYLANYSEGWKGLGAITPVSKDEFKKWIESSTRKTKPFAEYASVKPLQEAESVPDSENTVSSGNALGTITKDKHEKTGKTQWVVKPSSRVSDEEFAELKKFAKDNGGFWYGKKKGFIFYDEESANKFNNSNTDNNAETTDEQTAAVTDAIVSEAGSIAEKAGAIAESDAEVSENEIAETLEKIDGALDAIDSQLSILGQYDSRKDFKEAASRLGRSIAVDLGYEASDADVRTSIWGNQFDVTISIPVEKRMKIDVVFSAGGVGDSVSTAKDITVMLRHQTKNQLWGTLSVPYGAPYTEILNTIKEVGAGYLPAQPSADNLPEAAAIISERNEKKKENSLPLDGNEQLGDLFSAASEEEQQNEPDIEQETERPTEINGYKVGDTVRYSYPGREPADVRIVGFEEGRPLLNSFGANWISELADWEYISRIEEPQNTENNERIISTGSTGEDRAVGEGDGQADEQPVTSGVDRGGQLDSSSDGSRSGRVAEPDARGELESARGNSVKEKKPRKSAAKKNTHNNSAKRGESFAPTTPSARFNANVAAIKKMRELVDGEKSASKDDMAVLRQFTGWGGLGTFFNDKYSQQYRILNDLLSPEEMQDAEMSINSAYFTPVGIIDRMWDVAKKLGFDGGRILEGSAGIGNILQQMPKDISENSDITAVEIDSITGNILKLLYPDADVQIKGFQDVRIPNNSVDLAITNVPFVTGLSVFDEVERDLSRKFADIHDFCIAKNVRKLKEGGIGIFITSKGTLDKSKKLRQWVVNEGSADFIGAFRLNNETFGGTSVTSDIIVIRKRVGGIVSPNAIDVSETTVTRRDTYHEQGNYNYRKRDWDSKDIPVAMEYNSYFVEHPEYMAGEMLFGFDKDETFRPTSVSLYPKANIDQDKALAKWTRDMRNDAESSRDVAPAVETENEGTTMKEGQMLVNSKGEICLSRQGKAVPIDDNGKNVKGHSKATVLKDYNAIKDALNDVLNYQLNNESDEGLKPLLAKLNTAYDTFKRKYGQLNRNVAISFLRDDVDFASTAAIENYKEIEGSDGKKQVVAMKTDIFNKRMIGYKTVPTPASAKDGIIVSMNQFGRIDTEFIAKALGRDEEDVKKEILDSGLAFMDPMTGVIEVSYRYLSGNVREKLAYARMHNDNKQYDKNIEALEKVVPADIPAHIIEFSLGSDWVDKKMYRDYAKDRFGVGDDFNLACIGGVWQLVGNTEYFDGAHGEKNRSAGVTGTVVPKTVYGHQLMIAAMNNTAVTFQKQEDDPITGSKVTITDRAASQAASQKMEEMKDDFRQWSKDKMMQDTELAERTKETYNNLFNAYAPVEIDDLFMPERFDGSVLTMRDKPFSLYKHQKKAVIRGTMEPVMFAHEVGAGKTYTLISTAMEMRRLGTAKKPMIVVQNATIGQFVTSAKELYPNAKILTVSDRDHTVEGRATFYAKIKYNDWDLIIVPQSVFDEIPDSEERKHQFVQEKIDEKMYVLAQAKEANADNAVIRQMQKELEDLEYELNTGETKQASKKRDAKKEAQAKENAAARAKKQLARKVDDVSDFDDMGIDAILVDEAHNYKKLGFSTSIKRGVKGVDTGYSQRAAGLYLKTRSVFDKRGWKNVVFATGTPISNTAAEIWTFMKYLMPADVMKQNHIYYFDDFVRNFGSIAQSLEFATNGKFKENTRFGAYVNVPELVRIWASVCDTVLSKDAEAASGQKLEDKLPKLEGGKAQDVFLPQSPSLVGIMRQIRKELEAYENMSGKEKKENSHIPLTCYGRAKKAAIDPRLVSSTAKDEPLSKTNKAVETILQDYKDTESYKGTCAVFCDNFQRLNPDTKAVEFNLFEEIKSKLVANGITENEIVIIKSGLSEKKKEQIFSAVNAGDIRVILGSTQTLGTGVNIQERLHMVIHMDAPDRPMDYTQRNGRILRQGNKHLEWGKNVKIVRFGVEDSLDVTSYQRLKTKSAFIDSIMNGRQYIDNSMENRTLEEEEGLFDSPVAVLSGSEFALLKTQAERELRKYQSKYQQHKQDQIYIEKQLKENNSRIDNLASLTERYKELLDKVHNTFKAGKVKVVTIDGRACKNEEESNAVLRERVNPEIKRLQQKALSEFWSFHKYEGAVVKTYNFDFDGVPASVNVTMRTDYDSKYQQAVKTKYYLTCPELGIVNEREMTSVRGAITYFKEQIATGQMHESSLEAYRNMSEKLKADNAEMMKRRGKEFAETDKLNQAKARVDEFTEKMKEEMAAKEAKYAAMASEDVSIDESDDYEDETGATETHNRETDAETTEALLDNNDPMVVSSAMSAVRGLQDRIGVPVRFVRGSDAKGHYTEGKNEVVINIGAHDSIDDVVETYLHEAVAHFGLRQLMGDEFDSFIESVWNNCTDGMRRKIRTMMRENGWSRAYATEEYIAELAQKTDYTKSERSLWRKIVDAVRSLINSISGRENRITDDTIREILLSSYRNLEDNTTGGFSSDEIAKMETPVLKSKGTFSNYKDGEIWARANLQGKEYVNKFSGERIGIGRKAVDEMLNEKQQDKSVSKAAHLAALQSVPEFIIHGIPAERHSDTHGREGVEILRLYSAFEYEGGIYRVKSTVRKVRTGDRYYAYEVQEMELSEERWENQKSVEQGSDATNTSINSITGAKLLKGVKKTNSDDEILRFRRGYHGSAADFDKFDSSFAGTGEGAMAHGYGTYVAFDENTGKAYAEQIARRDSGFVYDGLTPITTSGEQAIVNSIISRLSYMTIASSINEAKEDLKWGIQWAKKNREDRVADQEEALNFVNGLDASDFVFKESEKNLYEIEIPENDGTNYIDEMKTLSKSGRRRIADVVRSLPDNMLARDTHGPNWLPNGVQSLANAIENNQYAGLELRERLVDAFGSEQFASEIFSNAGFVGMLYDGKRDGECAVIFNTDDLFIMEHTHFRKREKPAPKKTGIGYKVFFRKNGKLYPPMVANPNGEDTPVGVWLDADAAPIAGSSKTGRPQVKAGGKGTQGGSGQLAYRPGWHLGTIPYAIQFNRKDENGDKTLFPKDFVWAEVEYAADKDYQKEAEAEGINASGKYQHSLAGLKKLPEDGFYMYRTNPNPETDPWIITGAMKVNRVLSRDEVDELVREAGREPQKVEGDTVRDRKAGPIEVNDDREWYESPVEFAERMVRRYRERYNEVAPIVVVSRDISKEEFGKVLGVEGQLLDDEYKALKSSEKNKVGAFDVHSGKIIILASENVNSAAEMEDTIFHENLHAALEKNYPGYDMAVAKDLEGIFKREGERGKFVLDWVEASTKKYSEEERDEDKLVRILTAMMLKSQGRGLNIIEMLPAIDRQVIRTLFNEIGYDIEGERQRRNGGAPGGIGEFEEPLLHPGVAEGYGQGYGQEIEKGETGSLFGNVGYRYSVPAKREIAERLASKLNVNIELVSRDEMPKGHEASKGLWDGGRILVCLENNDGTDDVAMTVIHEAVGHNGLRRLVGDENMDSFCKEVFDRSTEDIRRAIIDYAGRNGYDFYAGVEEYLAHLAEQMDFSQPERRFWDIVRGALRNVLAKIGINIPIDDRDLRWSLWQSYNANKRGELANDVARAVLANRLGFSLRADKARDEARRVIRDRVVDEHYAESAADMYNRAATNWRARLKETWVDQFSAVDELVKAIEKASGKPVKAFEDVRKALNQQSSKGLKAMERWENEFYVPLMTAIKSCMKAADCSLEDVERYVMLKHGLERNDKFAKRDAREFYQSLFDAFKKRLAENDQLDEETKEKMLKKEQEKFDRHLENIENGTDKKYREFREKDYGGLTALYSEYEDYEPFNPEAETEEAFNERVNKARKPQFETLAETELAATREVEEWENKFGDNQLELWARINAATKDTLKHQYESNMISRGQYEYVRDMFDYYVPLRGFKETTAEDMYSYYMSDQSRSFEPHLLKAKGRRTEAESPFGYIGATASSAIAADMKNQTKLALYYMVSNRAKNDLVTISDVWYENTGVDELGRRVFTPVYPEFGDSLSSAEVKKAYDEWEAGMQEKAKSGLAFKGKKNLDLHDTVMSIDSRQERSHVIKFKLGGEDKMMFINGNPRAAQAINGELNVETSADYQKVFGKVLRWFSGINTSYNPEFWLSNMQRDTLMALMSVSVKEDAEYNAGFRKNFGKAMKAVVKMNKAFKAGKLGDSQIENWYREFAEGGGITGYTTLKKNEEWELQLRKYTGDERKSMRAVRDAFDKVQQFGEAIEQMTRFAAYMTSRQQGRSIVESVSDAKELTVNFNRKGSGKSISWNEADKLRGKDGHKLNGVEKALLVGASWLPAYGRRFIMFFNASVQGLNTMYNLYKSNKGRFNTWTAAYLALGMMTAAVHALLDDDDDYLDIPDYERRNNVLIGAGGVYFKWAMPQETRIFYGLGDMVVNHVLGRTPDKNILAELLASVSDIAPLNPAGGLSAIAPSALTPIVELAMNRDFKGSRIYNDMQYLSDDEKKRTPKYLRAYKGTGRVYVNISQALNTLTGGDYADAGLININPAAIEHLVEGATGGAGTTIEKFIQGIGGVIRGGVKLAAGDQFEDSAAEKVMDWLGTDDFMVRNTPFIRRILTINDERYRNAHTTELFNYYKAEAEHTKKRMNQYINAGDEDRFDKLMDSGDIDIMNIYNAYKGILETYNTMIRESASNRERKELIKEQDEYRKEMIKDISELK